MRMHWYGCGLLLMLSVGCDDELPGGGGGGGGGETVGSNGMPCAVKEVVDEHCGLCHSSPPQFGAPFALTTGAELRNNADRVLARVNAGTMPPPSQPAMPAADQAVLIQWLNQGAPEANEPCTVAGGGPVGGDDDYVASDAECDYLVEFRAHGGQTPGDTSPFNPAGFSSDHYEVFYFVPPWTEEVHTIRVDSIEDNKRVLHHWLLYQEPGIGSGNGTHSPNIGLHTGNTQLLTGWAPGNNGLKLKQDVGVKTIKAPGSRFAIEIHYNTAGLGLLDNAADRSGARVCTTRNLRPKEAAVHWLGTEAIVGIGRFTATGTCSPARESHILSYSPHMHETGVHMKTTITRANGSTEILTDKPFAFEDQAQYRVDNAAGEVVVGPGDKLTTTCTFDSPGFMTFGPGTGQEMCYNFILAWPAGSLSNGRSGWVGGSNTCIDSLTGLF